MRTAASIVAQAIERGLELEVEGDAIRFRPREAMTPPIAAAIREHREEILAFLRANAAAAGAERSTPRPDAGDPACSLLRFADRQDRLLVRFCCEPSHLHRPVIGEVVYDSVECDSVLAWALQARVQRLASGLRDSLLDLKIVFGGRIDAETASSHGLTDTASMPRRSQP